MTGSAGLIGLRMIDRLREKYTIVRFDVKPNRNELQEHVLRIGGTDDGSIYEVRK